MPQIDQRDWADCPRVWPRLQITVASVSIGNNIMHSYHIENKIKTTSCYFFNRAQAVLYFCLEVREGVSSSKPFPFYNVGVPSLPNNLLSLQRRVQWPDCALDSHPNHVDRTQSICFRRKEKESIIRGRFQNSVKGRGRISIST
jgi:hypothetical protein